jgi:hypothetical protein
MMEKIKQFVEINIVPIAWWGIFLFSITCWYFIIKLLKMVF